MKPRIQAAALPYRKSAFGGYEILLVSCSNGGWGVPKGGVKRSQSPAIAAATETLEEAGILGEIEPKLGSFSYRKQKRKNVVHVFPLRVTQILARWEEEGQRARVWVRLTEAPVLLRRPELVPFLTELRHALLASESPTLRVLAKAA